MGVEHMSFNTLVKGRELTRSVSELTLSVSELTLSVRGASLSVGALRFSLGTGAVRCELTLSVTFARFVCEIDQCQLSRGRTSDNRTILRRP